ncbi:MAG: Uma2 family endonuclease [bacterium]|nr:Uma2 family endonuclease [bacterium]
MAVATKQKTYTVQDLAALSRTLAGRWEVVEGRLRELPPANFKHGIVAGRLFARLYNFVEVQGGGYVTVAETGFVLSEEPLTLRAPDIAFVRREKLPEGELPEQFARFVPDIVAEVVSPTDTYSALTSKVSQWLESGVRLVWVVDPSDRTVSVHRAGHPVQILREEDTLTGDDVLPGFACKVSEIFAR